jgi:hypothetical protein
LICGQGWTGDRVIERLVPALKAAVMANADVVVEVDGMPRRSVDELDLYRIGQKLALQRGSDLHRHFCAHCHAIRRGDMLGDVLASYGWSRTDHDRKFKQAADRIAEWLNARCVGVPKSEEAKILMPSTARLCPRS